MIIEITTVNSYVWELEQHNRDNQNILLFVVVIEELQMA